MNTQSPIDLLVSRSLLGPLDAPERSLLRMGALPIPWAWTRCFGILPDGQVVCVDDRGELIPPSADPERVNCEVATLVYAARRYPELASMLPARPDDAISCTHCSGTGEAIASALCGVCKGLGWVPSGGSEA